MQTPVVAGVSGAAILAALLSFGGGEKKPDPPQPLPAAKQSTNTETQKGTWPNQEGPWRAVCEEYAPNGAYQDVPKGIRRGYGVSSDPWNAPEGAVETTTKRDSSGQIHKIAVHKQYIGDLIPCIPKEQLSLIHLIIATLPDPDKTEMRMEFDRYVDALEKAAAIRGFHYSGYWFPWSSRQADPTPRKEEEVEAALLRREQPGVLLFHNDQNERLFIFVVGETPTSGVDRIQMVAALQYREQMIQATKGSQYIFHNVPSGRPSLRPAGAELNGPLMISGPHFSGALTSLAEVLYEGGLLQGRSMAGPSADEAGADLTHQVQIVSPDASSDEMISTFTSSGDSENQLNSSQIKPGDQPKKVGGFCASSTGCFFRSISIKASKRDHEAFEYLGRLGYRSDQIAQLIEDESGFGDILSGYSDSGIYPKKEAANPSVLTLTYPRELSAAQRLSDQRSEQLAETGSKLLSLSRNSAVVKLASQEPIEQDRPSTYAADAEISEVSNALESDVRVMQEKHIQCIVVSATNPLDRIFLLEYLHDRLPNIRLVAEDADQLEVSRPNFVDLTGTIVVSSLPTVPVFAVVRDGLPTPISFTGIAAEEQFLSVAALLDEPLMTRLVHCADYEANDPVAYAAIRSDGPWVSIAGEDGFELKQDPPDSGKKRELSAATLLFGNEDEKGVQPPAKPKTQSDGVALESSGLQQAPRIFVTFSLVVFALTFGHLLKLLNSERPQFWKIALLYLGFSQQAKNGRLKFAYVEPEIIEGHNRTYSLLALNNQIFLLNCLVLAVNPVSYPFENFSRNIPGLHCISAVAWGMAALMLIALGVSVYRFLLLIWAIATLRSLRWSRKLISLCFSSIMFWYLCSSIAFLAAWRATAITDWRRILTLDDGLSPVIPIAAILFSWAFWAMIQLRGVMWTAHRKMDLISPVIELKHDSVGARICDDIREVYDQINPQYIGLPQAFIYFFVAVVSVLEWSSLRGIEPYSPWLGSLNSMNPSTWRPALGDLALHILFPPSFEWWFGIWGLVMLLMTVVQTAYTLYRIWQSLARLLLRLESTRMKPAFEEIGKDGGVHIKLWDLGKSQLRIGEMALIIESLRRMRRLPEAARAEAAVSAFQVADLQGIQVNQSERDELNEALNVLMKDALTQLGRTQGSEIEDVDWSMSSPFWRDAVANAAELDRYLALRISTLVRYVLLQMRNLMWFVIYGYFLAIVSVMFYPFQGGKNLSDMLGVTFVILLVMMTVLVASVLRNPMLKRLEDHESNTAGVLQAFIHLVTVGGLPALALLAWQFPWVGQVAFSWLRPLLSTFR